MSHWKAYAKASDVADADLRRELIATYETVFELATLLDAEPDTVVGAVEELRIDVKSAQEEAQEAQAAAAQAEERLEAKLQEEEETELGKLRAECEELRSRIAKVEPLLDAYSDTLAFARKFVTLAEGAGVKPRHVRRVAR